MLYLYCRITFSVGLNCDQMEEGEQYNEYPVESNPRAYMTMRDYRNLPWQWQQPVERNPNPYRSMREYRDQWMSAPVYNVPSTYIPPASPHFTSISQQQQPPPLSPVEQVILNLSKQVDNFIEEQRVVTVQANQETETVESSLNKELDEFQSEIDQKLDILQESILKLTNQLIQQEEESPKEECLNGTMVEEPCLQQPQKGLVENSESSNIGVVVCLWEKKDAIPLLLTEEAVEEHKENNLPLPPTDSVYILPSPASQSQPKTLTANAQATYNPLPVYILPAANSKPTAPAPKAKSNPSLPAMQNFNRLVAFVHNFATTSKTMAAAHIAWHSGWFGCWFGFGAPEPQYFLALPVPTASKGLRKWFGGNTVSLTFCFNFSCFILFYCILF